MSAAKNAEIAKEFYDRFLADDLEGMGKTQTDDVVWTICPGPAADVVPYFGVFRGREGYMDCINRYLESAEPEVFELTGYYGDADKAFVTGHEKVLAKATGKRFETDFLIVFDIHDDKITRLTGYFDSALLMEAFTA
ncbi:MAG: nuclear transport factor 2 family protein [Alphaproteobacteria bacterium]